MAEYIELTEELTLSMRAGARAILNTKKYHGTIYMQDVFSDSPKEMPYLKAAEILYTASEREPEDVAPVVHGQWEYYSTTMMECSNCKRHTARHKFSYCPHCGSAMEDHYNDM